MNTYSFSTRIKLILVVVFSLCTITAFAAPPPSWDEDEASAVNDEADSAPIDGFIGIAMAAGAAYGYKALQKKP